MLLVSFNLKRIGLHQLEPMSTLASFGWSCLQPHPVNVCIFLFTYHIEILHSWPLPPSLSLSPSLPLSLSLSLSPSLSHSQLHRNMVHALTNASNDTLSKTRGNYGGLVPSTSWSSIDTHIEGILHNIDTVILVWFFFPLMHPLYMISTPWR